MKIKKQMILLGLFLCISGEIAGCGTMKSAEDKNIIDNKVTVGDKEFEVVNGRVEVYLPVCYTESQTMQLDNNVILQNKKKLEYNTDGLLVKEEIHEDYGSHYYDFTNTYQYNTEYQLVTKRLEDYEDNIIFKDDFIYEYFYNYENGILSSIEEVQILKLPGTEDTETRNYRIFDTESGVLTKFFYGDSEWSDNYTYQYDKNANITRCDMNTVYGDGEDRYYYTYFDENTSLMNKVYVDSYDEQSEYEVSVEKNKFNEYYSYYYDENDRLVKIVCVHKDGEQSEYELVYDAEGYVISSDRFSGTEAKFSYNKQHKLEMFEQGSNKYSYEYDKKLISKIMCEGKDEVKLYNLRYDENGNLIEITNDQDENYRVTIEYEKFYVAKEYFEYYINSYYYHYQKIPLETVSGLYIVEINNNILQNDIISEISRLFSESSYILAEDYIQINE